MRFFVSLKRRSNSPVPVRRIFLPKVPRPRYSVLDNKALREAGLDIMPEWIECLRNYLKETGELKAE